MMRLSEKIRVEPLTPDRAARIEARVLAAFDGLGEPPALSRRPSFRWLVPAVAVAGVAVAVFLNVRASRHTVPQPVIVAQHEPMRIVTGAEATQVVVGRATIQVGVASDVAITRTTDGGVSLAVANGRVDCEVEPRPDRPPFLVHAGRVKVTVVGTIFSVERGDGVRVQVTRGRVRVDDSAGSPKLIAAGQSWTGFDTAHAKHGGGTTSVAGAAVPDTAKENPHVAIDTRHKAKLRRRTSKVPVTGTRSARTTKPRPAPATKPATKAAEGPWAELRTARITMAPLLSITATRARDMETEYRTVSVKGRGDRAAHALYSLAYVQLLKLGSRRQALKTIGFYQRRFARGKHARDVQWLRIRALCRRGGSQQCRSAAHAYLNRFGASGERGRFASRITDWGM